MEKPNKCPNCGARTSRAHTGVVFLKGHIKRGKSLNSSENNTGWICVQCGKYKILWRPKKNGT